MKNMPEYFSERGTDITVHDIEIVVDEDQPEKVEIYMLNKDYERIEGGTFDREAFVAAVLAFYNANY
jgi:hypothetical protein